MHFSIPETLEQRDAKGNTFTAFAVHINGSRHCVCRYRQLHFLHEQLRRDFPSATLPPFPPKKLLPLNSSQVEERREKLERYLQHLSLDPRVINGVTFNGFLLASQLETREESSEDEVNLEVFLMNDQKVSVRGLTILQTEEVLERVCKQHGVPDEFVYHFALYLMQRKDNGDIVLVRKLQDFESPYISQKTSSSTSSLAKGAPKLVLRKASWAPQVDEELFNHNVTLNLLYIQTVAEVERGWIQANPETKRQLTRMQARGAKREYMEAAYRLPYYGYLHFQPCICDYPMTNTPAQVIIGNRELVLKIRTARGELKEGSFKVTKMRSWRIMTIAKLEPDDLRKDCDAAEGNSVNGGRNTKLELSFEYLMNNQELQWITIVSSQAILMSLCLQSMVEELLRMRSGVSIKKAGEMSCTMDYAFLRKDGTSQKIPIKTGLHSTCSQDKFSTAKLDPKTLASLTSRQYSVKRLSARFDVVNFSETSRAAEDVFYENEAFIDVRGEQQPHCGEDGIGGGHDE